MSLKEEFDRLSAQQNEKARQAGDRADTYFKMGQNEKIAPSRREASDEKKKAVAVSSLGRQVIQFLAKNKIEDTPATTTEGLGLPVRPVYGDGGPSFIRKSLSLEDLTDRFRPRPFEGVLPSLVEQIKEDPRPLRQKLTSPIKSVFAASAAAALDNDGRLINPTAQDIKRRMFKPLTSGDNPITEKMPKVSPEEITMGVERIALMVSNAEMDLRLVSPDEARLVIMMRRHNLWGQLALPDQLKLIRRDEVPKSLMPPEKGERKKPIDFSDQQLEILKCMVTTDHAGNRLFPTAIDIVSNLYKKQIDAIGDSQERAEAISGLVKTVSYSRTRAIKLLGVAFKENNRLGDNTVELMSHIRAQAGMRNIGDRRMLEAVSQPLRRHKQEKQPKQKLEKVVRVFEPKKIEFSEMEQRFVDGILKATLVDEKALIPSKSDMVTYVYGSELEGIEDKDEKEKLLERREKRISSLRFQVLKRLTTVAGSSSYEVGQSVKGFVEGIRQNLGRLELSDQEVVSLLRHSLKNVKRESPRRNPERQKNSIELSKRENQFLDILASLETAQDNGILISRFQMAEKLFGQDLEFVNKGEAKIEALKQKETQVSVIRWKAVEKLKKALTVSPDKIGQEINNFYEKIRQKPAFSELTDEQIINLVDGSFKRPKKEKQPKVFRERRVREEKVKEPKKIELSKREHQFLDLLILLNSTDEKNLSITSYELAKNIYSNELALLGEDVAKKEDALKLKTLQMPGLKLAVVRKLQKAVDSAPDLIGQSVKDFFNNLRENNSQSILTDKQIIKLVDNSLKKTKAEKQPKVRKERKVRQEKVKEPKKIEFSKRELQFLEILSSLDPSNDNNLRISAELIAMRIYANELVFEEEGKRKKDVLNNKRIRVFNLRRSIVNRLKEAIELPDKSGQSIKDFYSKMRQNPKFAEFTDEQIINLLDRSLKRQKVERVKTPRAKKEKLYKTEKIKTINFSKREEGYLDAILNEIKNGSLKPGLSRKELMSKIFAKELELFTNDDQKKEFLKTKSNSFVTNLRKNILQKLTDSFNDEKRAGDSIRKFIQNVVSYPKFVEISEEELLDLIGNSIRKESGKSARSVKWFKESTRGKITMGKMESRVLALLSEFDIKGEKVVRSITDILNDPIYSEFTKSDRRNRLEDAALSRTRISRTKSIIINKLKGALESPDKMGDEIKSFFERVRQAKPGLTDEKIISLIDKSFTQEKQPKPERIRKERLKREKVPVERPTKEKKLPKINLSKRESQFAEAILRAASDGEQKLHLSVNDLVEEMFGEHLATFTDELKRTDDTLNKRAYISNLKSQFSKKIQKSIETPSDSVDQSLADFLSSLRQSRPDLENNEKLISAIDDIFRVGNRGRKTKAKKLHQGRKETKVDKSVMTFSADENLTKNLAAMEVKGRAMVSAVGRETTGEVINALKLVSRRLGFSIRTQIIDDKTVLVSKFAGRRGPKETSFESGKAEVSVMNWGKPSEKSNRRTKTKSNSKSPEAVIEDLGQTIKASDLLYQPERNGRRDWNDISYEDEVVAYNLTMVSKSGLPTFRDTASFLLVALGNEYDQANLSDRTRKLDQAERKLDAITRKISETIVRGRELKRLNETLPDNLDKFISWLDSMRVNGRKIYPDHMDKRQWQDYLNRRISIFDL